MAVKRTNDVAFSGHTESTSATLTPGGDFTVAGWVKYGTSATNKGTWSCGDNTTMFNLQTNGSDQLILKQGTGPTARLTRSTALTTGVWYYVGITKTSSLVTLYFGDESTAVTAAASGDPSGWGTLFTAGGQRFFGSNGEGYQCGANSEMAYWRSWNGTALSEAQLQAEQYKKSAVITTNLRTEYDFAADASKNTDSSANGFTLTPAGSATWADGTDPSGLSEVSSYVPHMGLLGVG